MLKIIGIFLYILSFIFFLSFCWLTIIPFLLNSSNSDLIFTFNPIRGVFVLALSVGSFILARKF